MTDILDQILEKVGKEYESVQTSERIPTFINKSGVVFHLVHVPGLEMVCAEYCPSIELADTYDYEPGDDFWDKTPVDELYLQLKKEIDAIEPT